MVDSKPSTDQTPKDEFPYSSYLNFCHECHIDNILTKEQWDEFISGDVKPEHIPGFVNNLGFNPGPGAAAAIAGGARKVLGPAAKGLRAIGKDGWADVVENLDTMTNPSTPLAEKAKAATEAVNSTKNFIKDKGFNNTKIPDLNKQSLFESTSGIDPLALSRKPNPLELSYAPAIPHTAYIEYSRNPVYSSSCPLYLSQIEYQLPSSQTSVDSFFENVLLPNLRVRIAASVAFNADTSIVVALNMRGYFNSVMKGLGIYYFYANILSYCSLTSSTNRGMFDLREQITADDMMALSRLEERLQSLPFPKELNEQAYWLFNNYKSTNDLPNSAMLKFSPIAFSSTTGLDIDDNAYMFGLESQINTVLAELNPGATSGQAKLINLLARVCPDWIGNQVGVAFAGPKHDPHWMDVWSNSPSKSFEGTGAVFNYPACMDDNSEVDYVTHNNEFSGMNQWLFSGWSGSKWSGALKPLATIVTRQGYEFTDNRFAYYTSTDGVNNFYPMSSGALKFSLFKYPESALYNCGADRPGQLSTPHSTMAMLGINALANAQATMPCLQFLYNLDSVGNKARLTGFTSDKGTGKSRSRRGKRRSKREDKDT